MGIVIEILVFFGVIGSIVWAGIRDTGKAVSEGVKEKMREREARQQSSPQVQNKPANQPIRPDILQELQKRKDRQMVAEVQQIMVAHSPYMQKIMSVTSFLDSFTADEKEAIIISLFVIAVGSEDPNPITALKQEEFIIKTAQVIGYKLNHDRISYLLMQDEGADISKRLSNLSQEQREWYAVTLYVVMSYEGNLTPEKNAVFSMIMQSIGIRPDSIHALIEKQSNKWFPK